MELLHAVTGPPVIVGLLGILVAWWFYIRRPDLPKKLAQSMYGLYTLVLHKYYVDEIYAAVIIRPLLWISTNVLWHTVDEGLIDGTVNGSPGRARDGGNCASCNRGMRAATHRGLWWALWVLRRCSSESG